MRFYDFFGIFPFFREKAENRVQTRLEPVDPAVNVTANTTRTRKNQNKNLHRLTL